MTEAVREHAWSIVLLAMGSLMLALWAAPRARAWRLRFLARPDARSRGATRDPVGDVARDAEELARHLAAQIDAKAERLERLIRAADDRLAALECAAAEGLLDAPARRVGDPSGDTPPARIGRAIGAVTLEADPITRRIHELADDGKSAREIALTLGEHVGKVQLVLALRG